MSVETASPELVYATRKNIVVPIEDGRTAAAIQTAASARLVDIHGSGAAVPLPKKAVN